MTSAEISCIIGAANKYTGARAIISETERIPLASRERVRPNTASAMVLPRAQITNTSRPRVLTTSIPTNSDTPQAQEAAMETAIDTSVELGNGRHLLDYQPPEFRIVVPYLGPMSVLPIHEAACPI